jgi:hypothetical protein
VQPDEESRGLAQAEDDVVHIHRLARRPSIRPWREDAADQRSGSLGGHLDLFEARSCLAAEREARERKLSVPRDHCEQVVEIVCRSSSGGQLLLRLPGFVERFDRGDYEGRLPSRVAHERGGDARPDRASVTAQVARFESLGFLATRRNLFEERARADEICRVGQVGDRVLPLQFCRRDADESRGRLIRREDLAVQPNCADPDWSKFEQHAEIASRTAAIWLLAAHRTVTSLTRKRQNQRREPAPSMTGGSKRGDD